MNKIIYMISLLTIFLTPISTTQAQWVVIDPANLVQNVLQAIRMLQSNLNEVQMIANQVQQLANDIRNLEKLPYNIVDEYTAQFEELFAAVGSVHGLMQDLSSLHSRFDDLYPDFNESFSPIPGATVSQKANEWLNESRQMMLAASITGAKVLEDIPKTHERLDKLLVDSSNAVGILQAAQAGNQIAATVAGNITNLSAQLASYTQAHSSFLMQINAGAAAGKNRLDHVLDGYIPSTHPGVPLRSY